MIASPISWAATQAEIKRLEAQAGEHVYMMGLQHRPQYDKDGTELARVWRPECKSWVWVFQNDEGHEANTISPDLKHEILRTFDY